jgi:hypothetical protein
LELIVSVDKTEARVGDVVTITASLKNLSNNNLSVQAATPNMRNLSDILIFMIAPYYFSRYLVLNDLGGNIRRNTFERGAIIKKQFEFVITEQVNHFALVNVFFSIGRENRAERMRDEQSRTWIHLTSNEFLITVQG